MKLAGNVSIGRSQGPDGNSVRIEVMDERSRVTFLTLSLTMEQYAEAITGLSHRPCEMEVRGLDLVGMVSEYKTVDIAFPYVSGEGRALTKIRAAETVAEHETDGWRGRPDDLLNHHNLIAGKPDIYLVHFSRHVPAPPEVP